eukprot:3484533-Rhodomonas_salina.1
MQNCNCPATLNEANASDFKAEPVPVPLAFPFFAGHGHLGISLRWDLPNRGSSSEAGSAELPRKLAYPRVPGYPDVAENLSGTLSLTVTVCQATGYRASSY